MSGAHSKDLAALLGYRATEQTRLLLQRALDAAAQALRVPKEEAHRRVVGGDGTAFRAFADAASIHETYFFRHPEHFDLLGRLCAQRAESGHPLQSAWSVGCSTGEEAWSLALSLWPWSRDVRVVGSDVSPKALETARGGRYPARAFRHGAPEAHPGLRRVGGHFEVTEAVKARVSFAPLNLAKDDARPPPPLPPQVDVIFCRNVLVYLTPELARRVFSRLAEALAPEGLLVVGAVEVPPSFGELLEEVAEVPGAFRPRRREAQRRRLRAQPAPAAPGPPEGLEQLKRLANEGRRREALALAARLGEAPTALFLSASIHLEAGDTTRAGALLRRMLERQPDSVPAHLQLALLASRARDARAVAHHVARVEQLLSGRGDEEELGIDGMRAAWARQVLLQLRPEVKG